MKQRRMVLLCLLSAFVMLSGCGKKGEDNEAAVSQAAVSEQESEAEELSAPKIVSKTAGSLLNSEESEVPSPEAQPQPAAQESAAPASSGTQAGQGTAAIITDEEMQTLDGSSDTVRAGTNQSDAVLMPMNTKLYGTATKEGCWYAFTTGPDANARYTISTVNKTFGSELNHVGMSLHNMQGDKLGYSVANDEGIATPREFSNLEPDTIYYVRVYAADTTGDEIEARIDYRLEIKSDKDTQETGFGTADNLSEARGNAAAAEGTINPGTNQDDAAFIPLNAKLSGTATEAGAWFAFTTNQAEGIYDVTAVNQTADSLYVGLGVYDDGGYEVGKIWISNDGVAKTVSSDKLKMNTAYFIHVYPSNSTGDRTQGTVNYTLTVNAPKEMKQQTGTAVIEPLVFETPFELREEQVMFKAESADFVDPKAAKAALQPIADIILAHPDNSILLAGTTATDGSQEARVDLSNRRAAAVKELLVNAYGVQETQLLTVGLGFEADPFVRGKDRDANGKFVETEGAKNRRVVIMDANDPIAQELLGQK